MKKVNQRILILLLCVINLCNLHSQDSCVIISKKNIEERFPCYYSLGEIEVECFQVNIEKLSKEVIEMEGLILQIHNKIILDSNMKMKQALPAITKNWQSIRDSLLSLHVQSNLPASNINGVEMEYYRDLTKLYLISLLPLLNDFGIMWLPSHVSLCSN